jgi:hypothetical protein
MKNSGNIITSAKIRAIKESRMNSAVKILEIFKNIGKDDIFFYLTHRLDAWLCTLRNGQNRIGLPLCFTDTIKIQIRRLGLFSGRSNPQDKRFFLCT